MCVGGRRQQRSDAHDAPDARASQYDMSKSAPPQHPAQALLQTGRCGGWRDATPAELDAALLPEQRPINSHSKPPKCHTSLQHHCLGQCRGGRRHEGDFSSFTRVCRNNENATHDGLRAILEVHVRPPSCALTIAGDSVLHDFWTSIVIGAQRLGYRQSACLYRAGRDLWHDFESSTQVCNASNQGRTALEVEDYKLDSATGAATFFSSWANFSGSATSACSSFTIRYVELGEGYGAVQNKWAKKLVRPRAAPILETSSVVAIGMGAHGNDASTLKLIWNVEVLPILVHLKQTGAASSKAVPHAHAAVRPKVVWLGAFPQHFNSSTGSGAYHKASLSDMSRMKGNRCVPANESRAAWRNDLFNKWVAPHRTAPGWTEASPFGIFFERHDLHSSFHMKHVGDFADCTHYCYTPFLYQPVWTLLEHALQGLR